MKRVAKLQARVRIPRARPADRSALGYNREIPLPRIPPACPAGFESTGGLYCNGWETYVV